MKLAILGEKKSILGFKALGVETFGIGKREDFFRALQEIETGKYAILFITEEIAKNYERDLEKFYQKTLPAVLIIPGISKRTEKGKETLRKIIERALGSEMIKI